MRRPPVGRLVALFCSMALALGAIFVRLTVLQVSQAADLKDRAVSQRVRTVALPAQRGQILDRAGERLALSMPARDVYADPRFVVDPVATAQALAPLLRVAPASLMVSLTSDSTFVYLARQVDLDVAERIDRMSLPGVGFLGSSARSYPAGALASQVLGFVGVDGGGLAGLELKYQDLLAGTPGQRIQELDPYGKPIAGGVDVERSPVPGSSIVTTLDRELQFQAETALQETVEGQRARGGTVIVMQVRTGDVLAMASYPSFDPNEFEEARPAAYRNRAVTDVFEPGSTNKVITAAAAVQEGALPLDERLTVPWTMQVGGFTIHDAAPHDELRMTLGDIIAESSNIGAVQVANRVGRTTMAAYLTRFGLGRATGIGFPGESSGIIQPLSEWTDATLATVAYGQGIAATPLQMLSVYATIANRGRWVRPRLVSATIGPDGQRRSGPPPSTRRVISAESARAVTEMLVYAVEQGTGENAQIGGYQVAGKTGTARIPDPDRPGYLEGTYVASFIGFLPAGRPEVVVAAILDRPAQGYGGIVAAPLFQRLARAAIARFSIEPAARIDFPPRALADR
ncbi:MAG TPA: penicillin-binding protein 2 [Actinomycetota bacterium]